MKPLSEQDYYEILEIPRATSSEEIERAYRLARATYAEDSLAGYSIFDAADASAIRERVELAYHVLSDAVTRRDYDASLAAGPGEPDPLPDSWAAETPEGQTQEPVSRREAFEALDGPVGEVNGSGLRRARLRRGLEVEDVARITKVRRMYLNCLEEERFAELPARVYVRGFVMAYAACVGIDPQDAWESYMRRYDRATPREGRPGRSD